MYFWVLLPSLVRILMQIKRDTCEVHSIVFSVDPVLHYIDGKHMQSVSANLRLIPDFACLSETFLRYTKVWVKDWNWIREVWKYKPQVWLKNGNLCGFLSWTCPLLSHMAQINFNSWSRCLSWVFSQINDFKDLNKTWRGGDFETCLIYFHLLCSFIQNFKTGTIFLRWTIVHITSLLAMCHNSITLSLMFCLKLCLALVTMPYLMIFAIDSLTPFAIFTSTTTCSPPMDIQYLCSWGMKWCCSTLSCTCPQHITEMSAKCWIVEDSQWIKSFHEILLDTDT